MGAQLALPLEAPPAARPVVTFVAPPSAPIEPLSLTARIRTWLSSCTNTDSMPVRFYHLCDAFPEECASDLDMAARPFEIGHESGPNTYEAT